MPSFHYKNNKKFHRQSYIKSIAGVEITFHGSRKKILILMIDRQRNFLSFCSGILAFKKDLCYFLKAMVLY